MRDGANQLPGNTTTQFCCGELVCSGVDAPDPKHLTRATDRKAHSMESCVLTREELLMILANKANAPPSGPNELLVRHLKCKESRALAEAIANAVRQYVDPSDPRLLPPPEILPPLA